MAERTRRASQDEPEHRLSWARVPGVIDDESIEPAEGEIFRQVVTAELVLGGKLRVTVDGRMTYGEKQRVVGAGLDLEIENDKDAADLEKLLIKMAEKSERQLRRRLTRDSVMSLSQAIREGDEFEEDN